MLSYQHGYHAGNRADCLKHAILHAVLEQTHTDGKPLLYVETHAGCGRYDLRGSQAQKTGEAESGVLALPNAAAAPKALQPWLRHIEADLPDQYPGSPALASTLLNKTSRGIFFERHPTEHAALKDALADSTDAVQIFHQDGYRGTLRLQPRRGESMLVLLDPSYETMADMEALADWVPRALQKWPRAQMLIWLPLFSDERERDFGAYLSELDEGFVAGAHWPAGSVGESALVGSAVVGLRIGGRAAERAFAIAECLEQLWSEAV